MGQFKKGDRSIKGLSLENFPFLVFGIIFAPSLASFYFTLGERIVYFFYGKIRKSLQNKTKWKYIFFQPSHCIKCETHIKTPHLIPIFGYFLTKGKCHVCKTQLSLLYPFSEFCFLLLFLYIFSTSGNFLFSILSLFLFGHILVSMITDATKFILDYENLFFIISFGTAAVYMQTNALPELENLWVLLGFFIFYFALFLVFRTGVGLGDVFFAPVYAFLVGHPFWMLFLNLSYVLAVLTYFIKKQLGLKPKKQIPMGFFFGVGFSITYLIRYSNVSF
jgi:leader peptidase (prepilin peptidase) / N-methyltransferase